MRVHTYTHTGFHSASEQYSVLATRLSRIPSGSVQRGLEICPCYGGAAGQKYLIFLLHFNLQNLYTFGGGKNHSIFSQNY